MPQNIAKTSDLFPGVEEVANAESPEGRRLLLDQAQADGRIVEASRPAWLAAFERDPQKAAADLAGLAAGVLPK